MSDKTGRKSARKASYLSAAPAIQREAVRHLEKGNIMNDDRQKSGAALNRAKPYQLALFPMNNGATNVYYVLISGSSDE